MKIKKNKRRLKRKKLYLIKTKLLKLKKDSKLLYW